ncbi:MAG: thioredoxin family protein [Janthinobacterium lividum]
MQNPRSLTKQLQLSAYLAIFAALLWPIASIVVRAVRSGSVASHKAAIVVYQHADDPQTFRQFLTGAVAAGHVPVAHFYGDWCGLCRRFEAALPDQRVQAALRNTTLVEINIDSCRALAAYYGVTAVPTFIKLTVQGQPLAKITSAEWYADAPEAIAPIMTKLVSTNAYNSK